MNHREKQYDENNIKQRHRAHPSHLWWLGGSNCWRMHCIWRIPPHHTLFIAIQCSAIKALIFTQILKKTPYSLPIRVRYGVFFMDSDSDLYFISVTAVLYAISCHIGPCYNGTLLYLSFYRKISCIFYWELRPVMKINILLYETRPFVTNIHSPCADLH